MTDAEKLAVMRAWLERELKISNEIQAGNKRHSPPYDYFGGRILALSEAKEELDDLCDRKGDVA